MTLSDLVDSAPPPTTTPPPPADLTRSRFPTGTKVEVRRKFDDKWATGFEVAEATSETVQLRRLSDGELLPVSFAIEDVRKEKKNSTWWY